MYVVKSGNMILCKHISSNIYLLRAVDRPRHRWIRVVVTESKEDIESIKEMLVGLSSHNKHFVVEELTEEEEYSLLIEIMSH